MILNLKRLFPIIARNTTTFNKLSQTTMMMNSASNSGSRLPPRKLWLLRRRTEEAALSVWSKPTIVLDTLPSHSSFPSSLFRLKSFAMVLSDIRSHERALKPYLEASKAHFASAGLSKKIKKEFQKMFHRVSKADKEALIDYTGPGFAVMNKIMRQKSMENKDKDDMAIGRIAAVKRALTKQGLSCFTGRVHRGITLASEEALKNFQNEHLRAGGTFQDPAFLSTSKSAAAAFGKQRLSVQFEIMSKTGRSVERYSVHPKEEEVLFAPKTLFRIHSVEEAEEQSLKVVMEEIA